MTHYLVIGSGRWAGHLSKILDLAKLPFSRWSRKSHSSSDLTTQLQESSHVWLAISDAAIAPFIEDHLSNFEGVILHSSGVLEIKRAHSVHPLMSFSKEPYPEEFYREIAFCTTSPLDRKRLIPGLSNSLTQISTDKKAYYHALCVLAGNGSVLLWQKFFKEMTALGVPQAAQKLYFERIQMNLVKDPHSALTGPLVRHDLKTLEMDHKAFAGDPYQQVLESLFQCYKESQENLV